MRRPPLALLALAVAAVAIDVARLPALGLGLRTAFVLASAAPIGSVLLLAIARLTGADWSAAAPPVTLLGWLVPLAALAMLAPTGIPLPAHLALWSAPPSAAARAVAAVALLALAGRRLAAGAGPTFAGLTLAGYAALVTPVGADWLLPVAPAQPVSAVGMMLFLLHFAAACAAALERAAERMRRDLALLLVAALLGLCYLAFVDYLIVWYGDLPARVPFYLARGAVPTAIMLAGFGGALAAIATGRETLAAWPAAMALAAFAIVWIGGGWLVAAVALAGAALGLAALRERASG